VDVVLFAAMMLGILPALVLRFYMLKAFEGMFDERSVMFAFVVGMVAGVVVGVVHGQTDRLTFSTVASAIAFFVILWAFLDQFLRVVIFNSPRFAGEMDTTFYATAFGLGYGSMLTAYWFYRSFVLVEGTTTNLWVIASYAGAAFAFAVVHGSTGMLVGFGASEGVVWRLGLIGVLIQVPLNLMWWLSLATGVEAELPVWEVGTISMFVATAYSLLVLRWTMGRIVPGLMPPETMRARRRELRKRRRTGRAAGPTDGGTGDEEGAADVADSGDEAGE